jgi:Domain of unknown function (DUF4328)
MQESNLRLFALLGTIAAWIVCALSVIRAVLIAWWFASADKANPFDPILLLTGVAGLASNLLSLLSAIPILVWIYTAHANLRAAGVSELRHSPAWATFSFFVPIANLFVPFVAMRELANRSAGEPPEFAESTVDDVSSWWSCFVVSAVMGTIVGTTVLIDSVPGVFVTTPLWAIMGLTMFGQLIYAAAAFFIIKVMRLVTRSQLSGSAELSQFE